MKQHNIVIYAFLVVGIAVLFCFNLCIGAVEIPLLEIISILRGVEVEDDSWRFIILENRLPQAITALLCGSVLAANGLILQTLFSNPLAGPDVFGINSGAALGVALVMLLLGGTVSVSGFSFTGFFAILIAAFVGAMVVTMLISLLSNFVHSNTMLLIVGIMVGYLASSVVSLLNFFSTADGVKSYMIWGLGDFGSVSSDQLLPFSMLCLVGIILTLLLIKPLNILSLGSLYAESLGINTKKMRTVLLALTGILTAITTAFCGPILFLGLAVPHMARLVLKSENQLKLLPTTLLSGSLIALLCNLLCFLPRESGVLPLNVVTPIIGAPVIIYILIRSRK